MQTRCSAKPQFRAFAYISSLDMVDEIPLTRLRSLAAPVAFLARRPFARGEPVYRAFSDRGSHPLGAPVHARVSEFLFAVGRSTLFRPAVLQFPGLRDIVVPAFRLARHGRWLCSGYRLGLGGRAGL